MRAYLPSPRPWAADDSPAADQSRRSKQHVSADAKTEARGRNRKGNGTSTDVEVAECHGVGCNSENENATVSHSVRILILMRENGIQYHSGRHSFEGIAGIHLAYSFLNDAVSDC